MRQFAVRLVVELEAKGPNPGILVGQCETRLAFVGRDQVETL